MNDRPISRPTRHPHPIAGDRSHALRRPDRGAERGTALILSLLFTIIAMGIVFSGSLIMQANQQRTETSFRLNAQATQFARAGITDTLSWFRRQTSQPVTDFEPILDTLSVPPIFDTADPDVGIVREFLIGGSIWGRYEIWKEWGADPEPARLLRRQQQQVVDISASRGQPPGNAWRLRATGSIYRRFDDMVPLDQSPNVRLAVRSLETEIKRLRLAPPGQAAVCIRDGGSATVGLNGRVIGGAAAGISYSDEPTMTAPSAATLSRVTGSPRESTLPGYDDSPEAVFGLPYADLVSIADDLITNPVDFPSPLPTNSVLVVNTPSITFDASRPLTGTGVVYVQGNVTIDVGSSSVFNGLLYVDGDVVMRAPSEINGALVVTGTLDMSGVGDFATIQYDDGVLSALRVEIGNYRLSGAIRPLGQILERN
jgi:hypothetical protein